MDRPGPLVWKGRNTVLCYCISCAVCICTELNEERRETTVKVERSRRVNKERGEVQRGRTGEERQEEKSESEST